MPENNDEFECHDIYLAAYLKIAGCEMVRRRRQGNRVYFIFVNPGGNVWDLREAFFSGKGKIDAYRYSQEIKAFKEMTQN
jgi:hypothetical protein